MIHETGKYSQKWKKTYATDARSYNQSGEDSEDKDI
jgi:hypothetical protein